MMLECRNNKISTLLQPQMLANHTAGLIPGDLAELVLSDNEGVERCLG